MTEEEVLGMVANIPRLRAGRMLDDAYAGKITVPPDTWFDLTIASGGSRREAERAHMMATKAALKQGAQEQPV